MQRHAHNLSERDRALADSKTQITQVRSELNLPEMAPIPAKIDGMALIPGTNSANGSNSRIKVKAHDLVTCMSAIAHNLSERDRALADSEAQIVQVRTDLTPRRVRPKLMEWLQFPIEILRTAPTPREKKGRIICLSARGLQGSNHSGPNRPHFARNGSNAGPN
jgi:hypothetical protein